MKFENYMANPFPRVRKQMTHPFAAPAHPPILFDQSLKHLVYLVTGSSSILTLYSSMVFAARSRFISSRSSCPKVSCSNTKCFSSSDEGNNILLWGSNVADGSNYPMFITVILGFIFSRVSFALLAEKSYSPAVFPDDRNGSPSVISYEVSGK